jgi:hypothetical protein
MRAYPAMAPGSVLPLRSMHRPAAAGGFDGPGNPGANVAVERGRGIETCRRQISTPARGRTQRQANTTSRCTTGNSPQTNHIKNITSLFPNTWENSSVCRSSAAVHRPRTPRDLLRALVRGTPKRVVDFTGVEIEVAPARQVLRTRTVEVGHA